MKKQHAACATVDLEYLLVDLQSPDEAVRAKAVRSLCPCRAGWQLFEQHMGIVARLKKDPNPAVRSHALHVFEDAGEMQSSGLATNPREATNDMLRKKRASRFRPDDEESEAAQKARAERRKGCDSARR